VLEEDQGQKVIFKLALWVKTPSWLKHTQIFLECVLPWDQPTIIGHF